MSKTSSGSEEKEKWQKYTQLNAVRNDRIFLLDADKACSPTPITFIESLEDIIRMIYRDETKLKPVK